jgi:hypothetical protein
MSDKDKNVESEAGGVASDPQDVALKELEAIVGAARTESGGESPLDTEDFFGEGGVFDEGEPPKAEEDVAGEKGKKTSVRFNNLQEAEKETKKLQSERDKLQSEVDKMQAEMKSLEQARLLLNDINKNPDLMRGIEKFYQTGKFVDDQPSSTLEDDDVFGSDASYGTPSSESIDALVDRKLEERLLAIQQEGARKKWYEDQRSAFFEAHPNATNEDFNGIVEFMREPKNVTFNNIYELLNQKELVEERAKQLAEAYLRGQNRTQIRPSVGGAAGGVSDLEGDPEAETVREILRAGRKDSLLG